MDRQRTQTCATYPMARSRLQYTMNTMGLADWLG